mmetsp:Transcript_24422/g.69679  ORF Transcript_24422/g.69679 Transcript_24422/m.69679 type:complete len:92 (-) Transcript_24422:176-451(-)
MCRQLLAGRADPDRIGREGSSALGIACRCAHGDVVKLLLEEAGASPYLVPIGNGNFDNHVGDDIMTLVRQSRQRASRRGGSFVGSGNRGSF